MTGHGKAALGLFVLMGSFVTLSVTQNHVVAVIAALGFGVGTYLMMVGATEE